MKIAYVFALPRSASYKLGQMILPQLEAGTHGVDVVGMFFFDGKNAFEQLRRQRISLFRPIQGDAGNMRFNFVKNEFHVRIPEPL